MKVGPTLQLVISHQHKLSHCTVYKKKTVYKCSFIYNMGEYLGVQIRLCFYCKLLTATFVIKNMLQ